MSHAKTGSLSTALARDGHNVTAGHVARMRARGGDHRELLALEQWHNENVTQAVIDLGDRLGVDLNGASPQDVERVLSSYIDAMIRCTDLSDAELEDLQSAAVVLDAVRMLLAAPEAVDLTGATEHRIGKELADLTTETLTRHMRQLAAEIANRLALLARLGRDDSAPPIHLVDVRNGARSPRPAPVGGVAALAA